MWPEEERRAELCNRLRGIYHIPIRDGCGPLNGSDTFTQTFRTPLRQQRAATLIEELELGNRGVVQEALDLIVDLKTPDYHMGLPDPYCRPIELEAAERLEVLIQE